jgi:hypothetical protein
MSAGRHDHRPFWLDWEYDRNYASSGTSRYGNYLRERPESFAEIWYDDPSVEFASIAWRIATGPIMAPPLVRSHPRVVDVALGRSNWNGELIADVRLVSPRPKQLATARTANGDWWRDQHLNSWDEYDGIGEQELSHGAYLLTEVRLLWQLPAGTLPVVKEVPAGQGARFRQAVECLEVLVEVLNREVRPVIEAVGA